ncbi:MAG: type II secretion system F family protein [Candidatus Limivivens sp.]|nr:type II secretion system F family protein [Candidatus Limivivens sp.]
MDYRICRFHPWDWGKCLAAYAAVDGMISFLFYRSWIAFLAGIPGVALYVRQQKQARIVRQRKRLEEEFLMGMRSVASALAAGYSVENAFFEGLTQMRRLYGGEALICREFSHIVKMLRLNENLETLLLDLGERSGAEDIQSFGEVFAVAKRSGGDLNAIIRNTISMISEKLEVQQEIEVCLASKKMEQTIMSGIPFFILGYVGITSPEFLEGLYHTGMGVLVMTAGLAVYLAAFCLGRYFVRIEV